VLRLTFLVVLATRVVLGAPCMPGTLNDYLNLDPDVGCQLGNRKLSEFELEPLTAGSTPIDPQTVQITPSLLGMSASLLFTYNASATNALILESIFQMTVTPDRGAGDRVDVRLLDATATADAVVVDIVDLCTDFIFNGQCVASGQSLIASLSSLDDFSSANGVIGPAPAYHLMQDIVIDAGPNGTASLTSAQLTFTAVPEPSTMITLAAGLLTFVTCRRRSVNDNTTNLKGKAHEKTERHSCACTCDPACAARTAACCQPQGSSYYFL